MIRILVHDKEGPQSLLLEDIIHFCRERQVRWEKKYSGTFQRTALKDKLLSYILVEIWLEWSFFNPGYLATWRSLAFIASPKPFLRLPFLIWVFSPMTYTENTRELSSDPYHHCLHSNETRSLYSDYCKRGYKCLVENTKLDSVDSCFVTWSVC